MLYIWHGDDDFTIKERLDELKETVGQQDLRDANVTELNGSDVSPEHLALVCRSAPFLAQRRLVIVRGLLSRADRRQGMRRRSRGAGRETYSENDQWAAFEDALKGLPETTDVVLVDGRLGRGNQLLRNLNHLGQSQEFHPIRGEELRRWVKKRMADKNAPIQPKALGLLCETVGSNLWAMTGEVEKLASYCEGRQVEEKDVSVLVAVAREVSVFAALDAVFEGHPEVAQRLVQRLLTSGVAAQSILALMARQLRNLVLAQELLALGVSLSKMGQSLGITSEYATRKTMAQARTSSKRHLAALYVRLLETDIAIKTGQMDEELGLEMLVAWVAD